MEMLHSVVNALIIGLVFLPIVLVVFCILDEGLTNIRLLSTSISNKEIKDEE